MSQKLNVLPILFLVTLYFESLNIGINQNLLENVFKQLKRLSHCLQSLILNPLTLKRPAAVFSKMHHLRRGWNPDFLWLLWYYHKSYLSWIFYWNSSSGSEDIKIYSVNISYFQRFSSIFWIFWHFLVTKKLMTSASNRWCQHLYTFNMLQIDCLKIV